ncbi:LysR substrate-binding domain-containing protein [soil metagenome]
MLDSSAELTRMISSTALKYFQEVHRRGSIRAAAETLFIAASAVSRQILLLEEEIEAPLFERRPGRAQLKLTTAGELLLQYAKANDAEIQRVRSGIQALKGLQLGTIRFGVTETFARHFFPDFVARFNRKYPRITFRVEVAHTNVLAAMVMNDDLDAMIGFNPLEVIDLTVLYERFIPASIVVSSDHPLASRESVTLSDCVGHSVALLDNTSPMKQVYDAMFARAKLRPQQVLSSNSYELVRSASAAGLSIGFVNEHMSDPPPTYPGYRYIPLKDSRVKPARFVLCVRNGRKLSVAALTFLDQLKQELPTARTA